MVRAIVETPVLQDYYSSGLRKRFLLDGAKLELPPVPGPEAFADIEYDIDEEKYLARSAARLAAGGLPQDVPEGWPRKLTGPLAWDGSGGMDEDVYVLRLDDADKDEIQVALGVFKEKGLEGEEISRETFPLRKLGGRLDTACKNVYHGTGFVIIRGLDPEAYSVEDFTLVYLGLSSYIAEQRGKQDQRGSMLMHVMDRYKGENRNYAKPFHTDTVCDCLALVTQSCSAKGGKSILAPVWSIYNYLAETRPDLIHTMAEPDWPFDTYGRRPAYYKRALMFYEDGKIILNASRRLLVGHEPRDPRTKGIPGLTEAQAEAIDAIHFAAQKFEIRPSMQKGDLRFINNMAILHRREAFQNDDSAERHLVRIWLHNEKQCWTLPQALRLAWARVFDDNERADYWDIVPPRDAKGTLLRVAGSCD